MTKKLTALILALLMLLSAASCSKDAVNDTQASSENVDGSETEMESEAAETKPDPLTFLPEGLSYDGENFHVLNTARYHDKQEVARIFDEIEPGDIVAEAVYERNMLVTDRLGVTITDERSYSFDSQWQQVLYNSVSAQDGAFDAVVAAFTSQNSISIGTPISQGLIANLVDVDSIDITNPWWDARLYETLAFGENDEYIYALAGDINFTDNLATSCLFFNKTKCTEYGFEYPYQSVKDGTWTYDKMFEMSNAVYRDLDADGKRSAGDEFGYVGHNGSLSAFVYGSGMATAYFDETGTIVLNESEVYMNIISKVLDEFIKKQSTWLSNDFEDGYYGKIFDAGRALFSFDNMNYLITSSKLELDIGILPYPKADETQDGYCCRIENSYTSTYSIVNNDVKNVEMCGYVLDAMGAASVDTVTASVIDKYCMNRETRDEESREMLEIIFDSAYYPLELCVELSAVSAILEKICESGTNDYATRMAKMRKAFPKVVDSIVEKYTNPNVD